MGTGTYNSVYVIVTICTILIALSFTMLQAGEVNLRKQLQLGIDFNTSKSALASIILGILGAIIMGIYIYAKFTHMKPNSSVHYDAFDMVYLIITETILFNYGNSSLKFKKQIEGLIKTDPSRWRKVGLYISTIATIAISFAYFTFVIYRAVLINKNIEKVIVIFIIQLITYIFIIKQIGHNKTLISLCGIKEYIVYFKNSKFNKYKVIHSDGNYLWIIDENKHINYINKDVIEYISSNTDPVYEAKEVTDIPRNVFKLEKRKTKQRHKKLRHR